MYCVLEAVRSDYSLDLARIAKFMRQDTVIRSWLLELAADALSKNARWSGFGDGLLMQVKAAGLYATRSTRMLHWQN